jgi:hypothetical protein
MGCCTKGNIIALFVAAAIITAIVVPIVILVPRNNASATSNGEPLVTVNPSDNTTVIFNNAIEIPFNAHNKTLRMDTSFVNQTEWNIVKYVYGSQFWKVCDNYTADIKLPAGSSNSTGHGGMEFSSSPSSVFPADEVYFSYLVHFSENFNWVRGGILPGLWVGSTDTTNQSSLRVSWSENGAAQLYISNSKQNKQNSSYYTLPGFTTDEGFGDSVGRGFSFFSPSEWNTVHMYIKLNTPGVDDGVASVSVNDRTFTYSKMNWRNDNSTHISGILMHGFFGGNDASWATPVEQHIAFTAISLYRMS